MLKGLSKINEAMGNVIAAAIDATETYRNKRDRHLVGGAGVLQGQHDLLHL